MSRKKYDMAKHCTEHFEVIGNIFDNKELLQEETE
nr:MAG TPA: YopX protein [Caudoviricetes sp.]